MPRWPERPHTNSSSSSSSPSDPTLTAGEVSPVCMFSINTSMQCACTVVVWVGGCSGVTVCLVGVNVSRMLMVPPLPSSPPSPSPPPPPPPMVLVAYAGPVRPAAALRDSVLCLPTDIHSLFVNKPSSSSSSSSSSLHVNKPSSFSLPTFCHLL